jgi:hypothetical protein
MNKEERQPLDEVILEAIKYLDEADMPLEGRKVYDCETGDIVEL